MKKVQFLHTFQDILRFGGTPKNYPHVYPGSLVEKHCSTKCYSVIGVEMNQTDLIFTESISWSWNGETFYFHENKEACQSQQKT